MAYTATIGLETHVQLKTRSKMFCACPTSFGAEPNVQVCPVCLGYPGAMPTTNRAAVEMTVKTGLMIGSRISSYSTFDRKSYFYPDMPKNYQISQYDRPLCLGGSVEIDTERGRKTVRVTRIHLEEDVAKNLHFRASSGIDFNRAGVPLMEIVSEPDMETPDEAFAYLLALKEILLYGGISHCNLEEGNIRCDVNVSVRPEGQSALGTKIEIKNMNTFKGVYAALAHEIGRQSALLQAGESIMQETRRWDADAGVTSGMRSKEDAHEYRYFPEPDLLPITLSADAVAAIEASLPELPAAKRRRFMREYGLPAYDVGVLVSDPGLAAFFEECAARCGNAKSVSNWLMTDMLRLLAERDITLSEARVGPAQLAALIGLVDAGTLNSNSAREAFGVMFDRGGEPDAIVSEMGLTQVNDLSEIEGFVDRALADNPRSVEDYKRGKKAAAQFLVGQVMRLSGGKTNPQTVNRLIAERLGT